MCKHELKDLMGVAGGVICRRCGKHFDHIPKQEPEQKPEPEQKQVKPVKKGGVKSAKQ